MHAKYHLMWTALPTLNIILGKYFISVLPMRKNELRRVANNQLNRDKSGSHRDQKHRLFVINKVIHDLFKIGQIPAKWYGLNQTHIVALLQYWEKQKIKPVTMMKYMTFIRYFLHTIGHKIEGIDNQTLGLYRTINQIENAHVSPDRLDNPLSKLIFDLQSGFGLTFSEAIRLIPDIHVRDYSMWLTREVTFNSEDRVIPIRDETQQRILQSLQDALGNEHSFISAHGYHAILHIYRTAMQHAGLASGKSYRYLYAQQQFPRLLQIFSRAESTQIIMREMGLKSRTTLWGYLHE